MDGMDDWRREDGSQLPVTVTISGAINFRGGKTWFTVLKFLVHGAWFFCIYGGSVYHRERAIYLTAARSKERKSGLQVLMLPLKLCHQ